MQISVTVQRFLKNEGTYQLVSKQTCLDIYSKASLKWPFLVALGFSSDHWCILWQLKDPSLVNKDSSVHKIFLKKLYCSMSLFSSHRQNWTRRSKSVSSKACTGVKWKGCILSLCKISHTFQLDTQISLETSQVLVSGLPRTIFKTNSSTPTSCKTGPTSEGFLWTVPLSTSRWCNLVKTDELGIRRSGYRASYSLLAASALPYNNRR